MECEKCSDGFHSKNKLYLPNEEEHKYEIEMQKQQEQRECSLYEDKFISNEEYILHVKEHLDEIRDIVFD